MSLPPKVTVVIASRNRRDCLIATLPRHLKRSEVSEVIVVDNASTDGTARAVQAAFPEVRLVALPAEAGAAARNIGLRLARTRYVAFNDDDAWWADGALHNAIAAFERYPRLALIAPQILVGEDRAPDPNNELFAAGTLDLDVDLPGPAVLGFIACATVVRRDPFVSVGGFEPLLYFIADETLASYNLAAAGWGLCYLPDVVAFHHPALSGGLRDRDLQWRAVLEVRNQLLIAVMRRPRRVVIRWLALLIRAALVNRTARAALGSFLRRLPRAVRKRAILPPRVEAQVRSYGPDWMFDEALRLAREGGVKPPGRD